MRPVGKKRMRRRGEKRLVSKTGKNIESGFHGWFGDGKSWTNL